MLEYAPYYIFVHAVLLQEIYKDPINKKSEPPHYGSRVNLNQK